MAALMLVSVRLVRPKVFSGRSDLLLSFVFLVGVPLLAYPVSYIIPSIRRKGRSGQREFAFYFAFAGYLAGALFGIFFHRASGFCMLFLTYLFSVILLSFFNKLLRIRASGHATSVTGPIGFLSVSLGGWFVPLCALAFGAILWASLQIKRHTASEFVLGALICILSAATAWRICF